MQGLGKTYGYSYHPTSTSTTKKEIARFLLQTANKTDPETCYLIGMKFLKGDNDVDKNIQHAITCLEKAASQGNKMAADAMNYRTNQKVIDCLKLASDRGESRASYSLYQEYMKGELITQNEEMAMHYLAVAVQQGNPEAIKQAEANLGSVESLSWW